MNIVARIFNKNFCRFFICSAVVCCLFSASADAAITVRAPGQKNSHTTRIGNLGRSGQTNFHTGQKTKPAAASTSGGKQRLSIGRLYNQSGKALVPGSSISGAKLPLDSSGYALVSQVDELGLRLDRTETTQNERIDDLETLKANVSEIYTRDEIDEMVLSGGLPTPDDGDGNYIVKLENGIITLQKMDLVTGEYQGL
jgi:hypothetical protein